MEALVREGALPVLGGGAAGPGGGTAGPGGGAAGPGGGAAGPGGGVADLAPRGCLREPETRFFLGKSFAIILDH